MDVTGPRPPEAPPPGVDAVGLPPLPAPPHAPAQRPPDERRRPESEPPPLDLGGARWVPRSTLKMGLTAADVDARFAIDDRGGRITVTMYDRTSGEVLRQIPPAEVQDVIDRLAGRGLIVDVES